MNYLLEEVVFASSGAKSVETHNLSVDLQALMTYLRGDSLSSHHAYLSKNCKKRRKHEVGERRPK